MVPEILNISSSWTISSEWRIMWYSNLSRMRTREFEFPMIGEMGHPSFINGHFVLPDTHVFGMVGSRLEPCRYLSPCRPSFHSLPCPLLPGSWEAYASRVESRHCGGAQYPWIPRYLGVDTSEYTPSSSNPHISPDPIRNSSIARAFRWLVS